MNLPKFSTLALLTILTVSCGAGKPAHRDETSIKELGNKVVIELKTKLQGQLQEAMASGGPLGAISHCKNIAPTLTAASAGNQPGLTVSRTSSRVRNPDNAPDALDDRVLQIFQAAKDSGAETPLEHIEWSKNPREPGEVAHYYQALIILPLCLNCHGDKEQMKPEVVDLLARLYPDDQATGYQLGDFRGLVRVDIKSVQ